MSGSMRYSTVLSSLEIIRELYANDPTPSFECAINVPIVGEDSVEDGVSILYIERVYGRDPVFKLENGDKIYRTLARFTPTGDAFGVDVIIRSREADTEGATLSISEEANRIIAENRL